MATQEEVSKVAESIARERERGPKEQPKQSADEKFDRQKKALQKMTIQMLEVGAVHGLSAEQVVAFREALDSLGWLPRELRVGSKNEPTP